MIRIREFGSRWNNDLELNAKKAWLLQTQYLHEIKIKELQIIKKQVKRLMRYKFVMSLTYT